MAFLLDYLDWRGDLSFALDPVNPASVIIVTE